MSDSYNLYEDINYVVEDQGVSSLCTQFSIEEAIKVLYFQKTGQHLDIDEYQMGEFVSMYYGYDKKYIEQNGFNTFKAIECFKDEYVPGTKIKIVNNHSVAGNASSIKDVLRQLKQPVLYASKGRLLRGNPVEDGSNFEWYWVDGKYWHSMLIYKYIKEGNKEYIMCKNWDNVASDVRVDIPYMFDTLQLRSLYTFNIRIDE